MFWPRLSNAGLLLLMAALGVAYILPPGQRALVAQTCWEVPLCLHTRGHQSARTGVKLQCLTRQEDFPTLSTPTPLVCPA